MKSTMFLLLFAVVTFSGAAQVSSKGAVITWDKPIFDFGDIYQGEKVQHVFRFENTGSEPLIITNVEVTCGCTKPRGWPRDPIMPGARAELEVQFNSSGKFGRQNKVITIVSNATGGNSQITFTANILEKR